jgi:hypothetical protein
MYSLYLETETWSKEACELIDYDSGDLVKLNLEITDPGIIFRKHNQILFHSKELNPKNFEKLIQIEKNENGFNLIPNTYQLDINENICTPNSAWFIFKQSKFENKMSKYKVNQGDIIRIGRITTRIKNICFSGSSNNSKNIQNEKNLIEVQEKNKINFNSVTESTNSNSNSSSKKAIRKNNIKATQKSNKICRICYMEEDDPENPLVQPCICSGSMKFIHLKCLKHWINTRSFDKVESNELCSIYIIKPVECELCKTKFPDYIRHNGKLFALLDFNYEYKNYMILESLTLDKHKNKFLYVISLENNHKIKLGRGHDSDILLSDISVSRIHCVISTENKNVYVEDNNSKFGTLILIQSPSIQMVENLPLYFQVGRTFFTCRFKKQAKLFQCCGVSERPNLFYYHKQNIQQVNAKTTWTVKTDDFDDDELLAEAEEDNIDNKINEKEDWKSINLIEEENKENNGNKKPKLTRDDKKGTMLFDGSEVDYSNNMINKDNKQSNQNEINENINLENIINKDNIEINKNKNKDREKFDDFNNNLKSIETEKKDEEDNKSESIVIGDESINDINKNKNLIEN